MKQLTRQEAKALYDSVVWQDWTSKELARFQLFQNRLCVPFDIYHKAVEELLNRAVWSHEFANIERLRNEYLTLAQPPTLEEIMAMIPEEKRLVILEIDDIAS